MSVRLWLRIVLAWGLAVLVGMAWIMLFTLDWETTGAGALMALFAFPSILLYFGFGAFERWRRYAPILYWAAGAVAMLFFAVPAIRGGAGRDFAMLLWSVVLGILLVMFPVTMKLANLGAGRAPHA